MKGTEMDPEETQFSYKGKQIKITETHPDAVISIAGRDFKCHHHHGETGLPMWSCDEAYFMSPDIRELARHLADYGYMYNDPGRVVVGEDGKVVTPGKGSGRKSSGGKDTGSGTTNGGSHGGHSSAGGH